MTAAAEIIVASAFVIVASAAVVTAIFATFVGAIVYREWKK